MLIILGAAAVVVAIWSGLGVVVAGRRGRAAVDAWRTLHGPVPARMLDNGTAGRDAYWDAVEARSRRWPT